MGKGDGWGGPAKGPGVGGPRRGPPPGQDAHGNPVQHALAADKEARIEQLVNHLGNLALNAAREETQVSATIAALNRLDGMPVQANKNFNTQLTYEDLVKASMKPAPEKE